MTNVKNFTQYGWYNNSKNISHLYTESDLNFKQFAPAAALSLGLFGNAPHDNKKTVTKTPTVQVEQKNAKNDPSFAQVRDYIANWEGKRNKAYKDSKGIWTVGIGFNLQRSDAEKILNSIGTTKKKVLSGQILTDKQISSLFAINYKTALSDAKSWIPNLQEHPTDVQLVIIDFAFNLGAVKLNKFPKTKQALLDKNYSLAAKELETSKWYIDVARRGVHHVRILRSHANEKNRA